MITFGTTFRMIDSSIIGTHHIVTQELRHRNLDIQCKEDHLRYFVEADEVVRTDLETEEIELLNHVVGRTVFLIGDIDKISEFINEEGYQWVGSKEPIIPENSLMDTVIVSGITLDSELYSQIESSAKWSLVFYNCKLPDEEIKRCSGEGKIKYQYLFEEKPQRDFLAFRGTIKERMKLSKDGWLYKLSCLDNDSLVEVRNNSKTSYHNNDVVTVRCEALVGSPEKIVAMDASIVSKSNYQIPSSLPKVISLASDMGLWYQAAKAINITDFVKENNLNIRYIEQIRSLFLGFTGTSIEVLEKLQLELPGAFIQDEQDFDIEVNDFELEETDHTVLGIVLEPYTPYKDGIWFSPEAIKEIAYSFIDERQGAVDHLNHSGVQVVESFIAPEDMEINGQEIEAGTWLLRCRVDEQIYQKIEQKEYVGFSIKGTGLFVNK